MAWPVSRCNASGPRPSRQLDPSPAHFEEGVRLVSCLLEGLVQRKVATLVPLNVPTHMRQQNQGQETLCLQTAWGGVNCHSKQ